MVRVQLFLAMEAVPVQLEAVTPTTTGLPPFCATTKDGGFAQVLESALGKTMGAAAEPDVATIFPETSQEQKSPVLSSPTIPNLAIPVPTDFPQESTAVVTFEGTVVQETSPIKTETPLGNAIAEILTKPTPPTTLEERPIQFSGEVVPVPEVPKLVAPEQLTKGPKPIVTSDLTAAEAATVPDIEALPSSVAEETVKREMRVESEDSKAIRPVEKPRSHKTEGEQVEAKPSVTLAVSAVPPTAVSLMAAPVIPDQATGPSAAQVCKPASSHAAADGPKFSAVPVTTPPEERPTPVAGKQPTGAIDASSLLGKRAVTAQPNTSEAVIEDSNLPGRPLVTRLPSETRPVVPQQNHELAQAIAFVPNLAPNVVAKPQHQSPESSIPIFVPSDVVSRVERGTAENWQPSMSTAEVKSADSSERAEPKREDAASTLQAIPTVRPTVVQTEGAQPSPSSQSENFTQATTVLVEMKHAAAESTISHSRSETSLIAEPRHVQMPDAPMVARMIDRLGQAELHLGMRTEAFGNVQVHTVVRDSQVGLAVGGERGDLRSFLTPEVPGLENNLRQHDLRFSGVQFLAGEMTGAAGQGNSGGYPQQFHAARSFQHRATLGEREVEESMSILAAVTSGLSVHA